jgi:2-dehydro-3-deoxygluconokinase
VTVLRRVLTVGEGLGVLRARDLGSLATVSEFTLSTGGAEGNVAIGLARLGVPVTWVGRVGDDDLGRRVVRELRAEGVDVVAPTDAAATGLLVKSTPAPGRTAVAYYRAASAGSRLTPADVEHVPLDDVALVHVTGITPALSATAAEAIDVLVARARAGGIPISFDVNHRSTLWASADAAVSSHRRLATLADVVFAGQDEAALLVDDPRQPPASASGDPEDLARRIAALGPREVVVKLGEHGALSLRDGVIERRAAIPVDVIDTVGAGDAFVAGYLAELIAGRPLCERLDTGVRAGAAACTHPGDWEGSPTRAELARVGGDPVRR